jgi:hypothetical protein
MSGLAPTPLFPSEPSRGVVDGMIGTREEREQLCHAHGYEIDAVLAASAEFRRAVGGAPFRWMTRGEALHIARALVAVGPAARDTTGGVSRPSAQPARPLGGGRFADPVRWPQQFPRVGA